MNLSEDADNYSRKLREQESERYTDNPAFNEDFGVARGPGGIRRAPVVKVIITFGQGHTHEIDGIKIDRDSLVRMAGPSYAACRKKAFELFGRKFCTTHVEEHFKSHEYFPRGIVLEIKA